MVLLGYVYGVLALWLPSSPLLLNCVANMQKKGLPRHCECIGLLLAVDGRMDGRPGDRAGHSSWLTVTTDKIYRVASAGERMAIGEYTRCGHRHHHHSPLEVPPWSQRTGICHPLPTTAVLDDGYRYKNEPVKDWSGGQILAQLPNWSLFCVWSFWLQMKWHSRSVALEEEMYNDALMIRNRSITY